VHRLVSRVGALLAGVLLTLVAIPATSASAVPHPPPASGHAGVQGIYSLRSAYGNADLASVRAWQVTWTVPEFTNNAWGAVGQWFSNIEGGIYHTDTEGWWVYYYGDDNGLTGNNPDCFQSWGTGGHCLNWGANLAVGKQVTFVYEYCDATKAFNVNGPNICLYVNMNDGAGNRYLMSDLPRAEGPEMYAHDVETFADSGFAEPVVSCTNPIRMLGQRARIGSGAWTNLSGSAFDFVDEAATYEFRNVAYTTSPATWNSCSPPSSICPNPVWSPKRTFATSIQVYWNQRKYRSLTTTTGVQPGTSSTTWQDLGTC
jgi:hypothetical protein